LGRLASAKIFSRVFLFALSSAHALPTPKNAVVMLGRFDHPIHKAGNELESGKKERLPCQFFMKTGTCSYGTTCRFRHTTKEQLAREGISVEDAGPLPRNPDEKECTFFLRTGKCAYGFTCRFDHPPRDESNTKASSVKDES